MFTLASIIRKLLFLSFFFSGGQIKAHRNSKRYLNVSVKITIVINDILCRYLQALKKPRVV